jgi:hypothetical protein
MMHWTRILVGIVFFVCCGIAWAVFDIRRNLKRIKIAQAVIIATEEGDKILEAVQVVGVTQIKNHEEATKALSGLRTHMTSNHDEIDGELIPIREKQNWLVSMFDRYLKFEGDAPPKPLKRPTKPLMSIVDSAKDDTQ